MITSSDYTRGFRDGLAAAVRLVNAGCTAADLNLVAADPGQSDPRNYQDELAEIRKVLGAGFGDVPEEPAE